MKKYQVIVGNIGTVYDGDDEVEAKKEYYSWIEQTERGGRASGEPVTLMIDGEPTEEHYMDPPQAVTRKRSFESSGEKIIQKVLESKLVRDVVLNEHNALYSDDPAYKTEGKFKVEIHGVGDPEGHYVSNALRFKTKEDAEEYANDLENRWMGMDAWRVVPVISESKLKESEADSTAAREFALYIQNDGDLYRQRTTPIINNLAKKIKKGIYKKERALDLWDYLSTAGVKKYFQVFGGKGDIERVSTATRRLVSKELADYYQEEIDDTVEKLTKKPD